MTYFIRDNLKGKYQQENARAYKKTGTVYLQSPLKEDTKVEKSTHLSLWG